MSEIYNLVEIMSTQIDFQAGKIEDMKIAPLGNEILVKYKVKNITKIERIDLQTKRVTGEFDLPGNSLWTTFNYSPDGKYLIIVSYVPNTDARRDYSASEEESYKYMITNIYETQSYDNKLSDFQTDIGGAIIPLSDSVLHISEDNLFFFVCLNSVSINVYDFQTCEEVYDLTMSDIEPFGEDHDFIQSFEVLSYENEVLECIALLKNKVIYNKNSDIYKTEEIDNLNRLILVSENKNFFYISNENSLIKIAINDEDDLNDSFRLKDITVKPLELKLAYLDFIKLVHHDSQIVGYKTDGEIFIINNDDEDDLLTIDIPINSSYDNSLFKLDYSKFSNKLVAISYFPIQNALNIYLYSYDEIIEKNALKRK